MLQTSQILEKSIANLHQLHCLLLNYNQLKPKQMN